MQMAGHKTGSVFERYNVTGGEDLKEAAKKLNQAAKSAAGTVALVLVQPSKNAPSANPSVSMPGTGIEPVRPLRGSGF
jgi:hypothetical protein